MTKKRTRPRDASRRALDVVRHATEEPLKFGDPDEDDPDPDSKPKPFEKDPAAVALGRKGGLKGGKVARNLCNFSARRPHKQC